MRRCSVEADEAEHYGALYRQWRVGRIVLLVVGTAFEATITHFFAKGMWSA